MNPDFKRMALAAVVLLGMAKLGMVGQAVAVVGGIHGEPVAEAPEVSSNPWSDKYNPSLALGDGTFVRCEDAIAVGAAPLYIGRPGYSEELDPDRDGIACD